MEFSEKLNVLFKLAHAKGKDMANAMYITAPQISKMRKGTRGIPKNKESVATMAQFFSQRLNTNEQKVALSQLMNIDTIKSISTEGELSEVIFVWLTDERNAQDSAARRAESFLKRYGTLLDGEFNSFEEENSTATAYVRNSIMAYYGSDGKRIAVMNFLDYLIRRKQAYTISILSDESLAWASDNATYALQYEKALVQLANEGCIFRRIVGPLHDMNQAFDSLNRWLPLYLTGKATTYYYKRMRDNLNRITIFMVPNVAALFSFSIGELSTEGVTFFTSDEKVVKAMETEYEKYYEQCEPIMRTYSALNSFDVLNECMVQYENCQATCIQRNHSLSFITIPWEVALSIETKDAKQKEAFLKSLAQRYKVFRANLEHYKFTDIICLANVDDVMSGKVSIPAALVLGEESQYYSPSGYLRHLQSTLFLLEHFQNYNVVIEKENSRDSTMIYSKEDNCTIITRKTKPLSILKASERYLVGAFHEHLRKYVPSDVEQKRYRQGVIGEMRALAEQIEKKL